MTSSKNRKQFAAVAAVVAVGLVLAGGILLTDRAPAGGGHGEEHGEPAEGTHAEEGRAAEGGKKKAESAKGPHGGRLLRDGEFAIESTIFEKGVEPQFRLYAYRGGKPLDLAPGQVSLVLERLGREPQRFSFVKEADYLKGDAVVEEPHSFKVRIEATADGKKHTLSYEQVEAQVTMTDAQLQAAGVGVEAAGPAVIATTVKLPGEVKYNADRTVRVVPRLSGLIEAVRASAGDRVRKGQVLAVISSQGLADQRSTYLAAQRRYELARSTYERERKLWEEKISPEQDVQQARAAMQEAEIALQAARQKLGSLGGAGSASGLTRFELRSPIDGIVTEKQATVGQSVQEETALFTISDLSSVWVEANVPAAELAAVAPGQKALVRANGVDASGESRIQYVSPLVGEQSRSAIARAVLPNPRASWRPGMPVTMEVVTGEKQVPVAIAAAAVQDLRDWKVAFGRYGNKLEARPLKLGASDGRRVEVLEGLKPGERYVTTNSHVVKADIGKAGASHDH